MLTPKNSAEGVLFSNSLGRIVNPKRKWKQCLCKTFFLGGVGANKVYYGHLKAANFLHLTSKNIHNTTRWKSAQTSYCRSIFPCNTGYTETLLRKNSFPQYPSVQLFYYLTNFVIFRPQFFVRLVYRFGQTSPEILKIPGCDTFCPLEKFIE